MAGPIQPSQSGCDDHDHDGGSLSWSSVVVSVLLLGCLYRPFQLLDLIFLLTNIYGSCLCKARKIKLEFHNIYLLERYILGPINISDWLVVLLAFSVRMCLERACLPDFHEIWGPPPSQLSQTLHPSGAIPPARMPHLEVSPQSPTLIDCGLTSTSALGPPLGAPAWCNWPYL